MILRINSAATPPAWMNGAPTWMRDQWHHYCAHAVIQDMRAVALWCAAALAAMTEGTRFSWISSTQEHAA